MNQNIKNELVNAIKSKQIHHVDQEGYPAAHSEPYFYKTQGGDDLILLRAKERKYLWNFWKQRQLYPFLLKQNLPVGIVREYEIIECGEDIYAVMERFFGRKHSPKRYDNATQKQQKKFIKQIAYFFYKLHSIPINILPLDINFTPYFKYDNSYQNEFVFLHGDFNYSNFLVDDDYNLHAVFDWHPACIGPRIAEFSTFIYCNDIRMLPFVLEEYNKLANTAITPEQVIEHYSER